MTDSMAWLMLGLLFLIYGRVAPGGLGLIGTFLGVCCIFKAIGMRNK